MFGPCRHQKVRKPQCNTVHQGTVLSILFELLKYCYNPYEQGNVLFKLLQYHYNVSEMCFIAVFDLNSFLIPSHVHYLIMQFFGRQKATISSH